MTQRLIDASNRGHWEMLRRLNARCDPFVPGRDDEEVAAWVHAKYVRTSRDGWLADAVKRTLRRNGGTKRHWLAVDGTSNLGKSEMLLHFAMEFETRQQERAAREGRDSEFEHVPVIFLQSESAQQGAGLLSAIADSVGLPSGRNEAETRRRLFEVLPELGTDLIIWDDAHMFRRASPRATRLTDSLRATLRLPVAFVFAGNHLSNSALLASAGGAGYESTDQLRSRHSLISMPSIALPHDAAIYQELLGRYLRAVHQMLPHVETPFRKDNAGLTQLLTHARGLVGAVMGALKDATVDAALDGTAITTEELLGCIDARLESR